MRSVNQNHHLYVAKSLVTGTFSASNLQPGSGAISVNVCGDNPKNKDIYFKYVGWDGMVRSDLIPIDQITYVKYISAAAQQIPLRKVMVQLDSNINDGDAIVGQDYILNISFQQFYGLSPEDTYVKTVGVHVTTETSSAADFYDAMIAELNASFSREVGASADSNPYLSFTRGTDGNSNPCLFIEEKEQGWSLGKWEAESLMFEVIPSTIYVSAVETPWGEAKVVASTSFVPNSKRMADLEWFTFGERGDVYRGMGYPNNFDFRPMVNAYDTNGYEALEIHYAYQGSCEDIQKSEKDITIISSGATNVAYDIATTLAGSSYLNMSIPATDPENDDAPINQNDPGNEDDTDEPGGEG